MATFQEWLQYFAAKFGKVVVAVLPHYTSQECSKCGAIVKKSLSVRTYVCQCGCVLDRGENAAINILSKGLSIAGYLTNTLGRSEIKACREMTLYLTWKQCLSKVIR
jgi:putative transposase